MKKLEKNRILAGNHQYVDEEKQAFAIIPNSYVSKLHGLGPKIQILSEAGDDTAVGSLLAQANNWRFNYFKLERELKLKNNAIQQLEQNRKNQGKRIAALEKRLSEVKTKNSEASEQVKATFEKIILVKNEEIQLLKDEVGNVYHKDQLARVNNHLRSQLMAKNEELELKCANLSQQFTTQRNIYDVEKMDVAVQQTPPVISMGSKQLLLEDCVVAREKEAFNLATNQMDEDYEDGFGIKGLPTNEPQQSQSTSVDNAVILKSIVCLHHCHERFAVLGPMLRHSISCAKNPDREGSFSDAYESGHINTDYTDYNPNNGLETPFSRKGQQVTTNEIEIYS